jgi:MFS family permease
MKRNIKTKFYGWKNIGLLFFINFFGFGMASYSFTVIFPAMIQDMAWPRGQASIAHTLRLIIMGSMAPVLALAISRFGVKKPMMAGVVIMLTCLLLLATITTRIWVWTLLWGIVMPIGAALGGIFVIQTTAMFWFNKRRALAVGIVTSGAALSGFLAQPFFTWLMAAARSWEAAWLFAAGFSFIGVALTFFIVGRPRELGQYPDGINPDENQDAATGAENAARTYRSPVDWPLRQALKMPIIWLFILVAISNGLSIILVNSHGVLHLTDLGYSPMQAASVLSLIILASGIASLPMGWLADFIEPRWLCTGCMAGMLVTLFFIWRAPSIELLMVSGFLFGFGFGGILILNPTMIGNYFGPESFLKVNGLVMPLVTSGISLVPTIAGFIADKLGSYNLIFGFVAGMLTLGTICAFFLAPPEPTFYQKREPELS